MLCVVRAAQAQPPAASVSTGRTIFENRCSGCHGADGNGGELGPAIARRLTNLNDAQIKTTVLEGLPTKGMPANAISDADMPQLITFLRAMRPRRLGFQPYQLKAVLSNGKTLDGTVIAESFEGLQLRTADNRLHLLRRVDPATSPGNFARLLPKSTGPPITATSAGTVSRS
jgi:alcohol dehydrogenase (cytochrome c)